MIEEREMPKAEENFAQSQLENWKESLGNVVVNYSIYLQDTNELVMISWKLFVDQVQIEKYLML